MRIHFWKALPFALVLLTNPVRLLAQSSTEAIIVANRGERQIVQMVDMTGKGWATLGSFDCNYPCSGVSEFYSPTGVATDGKGRIYVADYVRDRIVRVDDISGNGWVALGSKGTGAKQFDAPTGIAVDSSGRIYITDEGNHRIVRIDDMTGAGWTSFGRRGYGVGLFNGPWGIAIDNQNRIYITDSQNHRIVRINSIAGEGWTPLGKVYPFIPGEAFTADRVCQHGVGEFCKPSSIAIDLAGRIYVADLGHDRIIRVDDMAGRGWTTFGRKGLGIGELNYPRGIWVDSAEHIYIADRENHRIIRINDMAGTGWVTAAFFNRPDSIITRR